MKSKILILLSTVLLSISCKAQMVETINITDYPAYYNQTINKLNIIIPNKTNFYGQPFSDFLLAFSQNTITIKAYYPHPYDNKKIRLMFLNDAENTANIWRNNYVTPHIEITFQQPYNFQQASSILNQYHWFWNSAAENFYKDLIIEKIEFWYVRGLTDKSNNPK